jgi:hypothetical protein
MRLSLPILALGAMTLTGCANSGSVSPLVVCDRPTDFNAHVFTNCTPPIGGDSPSRRAREARIYDDENSGWGRRK